MDIGLAVFLLLLSAYFGSRAWVLVAAGGVRLPFGGGAITRAKEPVTFWSLVIFYAVMTVTTALSGAVGAIYGAAL